MKRISKLIWVPLIAGMAFSTRTQERVPENCSVPNTSFKAGEKISYAFYYAVAGVYLDAGTATFSNTLETFNGKPVFHIIGEGSTNSSYNWIYKVKDRYETFIDTSTMQALKFIRNVHEGTSKIYQNVTFNKTANTAITNDGVFKVPECVQDVMSSVFYVRNVDFSKLQMNDKVAFSMFLDNQVYDMYMRYVGRETIKTKYGKFKTIKIMPLLIEGSIFQGGEKMTVWITDDPNHIPVRIESPLIVGKVKVDMMGYENLRHPLTSLVRQR
jgi:Protein of unknown function (DUF3108)